MTGSMICDDGNNSKGDAKKKHSSFWLLSLSLKIAQGKRLFILIWSWYIFKMKNILLHLPFNHAVHDFLLRLVLGQLSNEHQLLQVVSPRVRIPIVCIFLVVDHKRSIILNQNIFRKETIYLKKIRVYIVV